jgi:hypothetical protein
MPPFTAVDKTLVQVPFCDLTPASGANADPLPPIFFCESEIIRRKLRSRVSASMRMWQNIPHKLVGTISRPMVEPVDCLAKLDFRQAQL